MVDSGLWVQSNQFDTILPRMPAVDERSLLSVADADNQLMLDRHGHFRHSGRGNGVAVGDEFVIYSLGEAILDPDSGESLGALENVKGRVTVTHVMETMARAQTATYEVTAQRSSDERSPANSGIAVPGVKAVTPQLFVQPTSFTCCFNVDVFLVAFDPQTGSLWVGDVGEVTYEEITIARKGRHHGWPWREGGRGWATSKCRETVPDTGDCADPVYFCKHGAAAGGIDGDCTSITGGTFLEGAPWPPAWQGQYLFGDNANGRLYTVRLDAVRAGVVAGSRRQVGSLSVPVSIRLGPDNAAYIAAFGSGTVVRAGPPP